MRLYNYCRIRPARASAAAGALPLAVSDDARVLTVARGTASEAFGGFSAIVGADASQGDVFATCAQNMCLAYVVLAVF